MIRLLFTIIAGMLLGGVVHLVSVLALPRIATQDAYSRLTPMTKLNALNPNVEAIASYKPDLVVAADDTGGLFDNLKRLSIPALLEPAAKSLDDSYSQTQGLGQATGHQSGAADVVKQMRDKVASLVAEVPKRTQSPTYYDEIDNTFFSVTSDTFIGQLFKLAGLHDIADAAQDKAGGYPQLSAEFILQAKPDFIFLSDTKCCGQSPATVAARPGWGDLPAVKLASRLRIAPMAWRATTRRVVNERPSRSRSTS